jgi:hypothetical protein
MYNSSINSLQMIGPEGATGNVGPTGNIGPTGAPGATGNTGPVGAYVTTILNNSSYVSNENFLITRGTTLAFTGATTNSTPDVIETEEFIQITTKKIFNNRGGYRNEEPFQNADPLVGPKRLYLTNIEKAELTGQIQVVTFDIQQWSRNQCIFGFYRAHATAGNVTANPEGYIGTSPAIGRTNVECLIGFRPSNTGKWKACIVLEDVFLVGASPSIRYDRELWKIESDFSIYDINTLKVIVFNGTRAEFYINEQFIGEVRSTDLIFNVGVQHPVGGIDSGSGSSVPYLVHTHPEGGPYAAPYGPQPIFAGVEIRHFHTNQATSIVTESTDPSVQPMSIKVFDMSCEITKTPQENEFIFLLSNGNAIEVNSTNTFSGDTGYGNTQVPESVGGGTSILGSSSEGQLNIKGISGIGSLVVSATDNNLSIDTIYKSTFGNVYSVGLSADTLMYLKEPNLASSTRVKMDGTGDLDFQNQFYLNDSALIKYVGPVKKNQYVGITGAIDNFTDGTTGGIYIDLENGGFYVVNTPIGIAGFTGSFKQNEIINATLLLSSDNIWKFPENVYFEEGQNYLTCGKSIVNIFSFDSGQNWYAVVAQRGLDLNYTEKFITTTKVIKEAPTPKVTGIDFITPGTQLASQKLPASQQIGLQNQIVSSEATTNVKRVIEFNTCVPALSTGSCCYIKYPENSINCLDYVTKDECDSFSGQYNPLKSCSDSCGFTFGLCCSNGNCIEGVSVEECNFFGGNYYAGITCGSYPNTTSGPNYGEPIETGRLCYNPCEADKIACCKDGICLGSNYSRIQCELILGGKAFTGGDCSTINCCENNVGRGACCACAAKDLLCFDDLTPAECASAEYDGIFMGEEERCENVNCKCVGGIDAIPQTPPTFDLVLLNPTIRPNEQANIQLLNIADAEGGDLFYKVTVKQILPTENELYFTEYLLIQNQQITEYTTNPLSQVSTSLTKYEIIVSVKDEEDNTTTKSEIVTLSSNAPQATITEFEPILVEIVNYPTSKNVGPIIVSASDPDGGSITSYSFSIDSNTANVDAVLTESGNQANLNVTINEDDPNQFVIVVKCLITDDEGETSSVSTAIQFIKDLKPVFDVFFEPGIGTDWTGTPNSNYPTAGSIGTNVITKIRIPENQGNLLVNVNKTLYKELSAGIWSNTPESLEVLQNTQILSQANELTIPIGNSISGITAGIYVISATVSEEPYTSFNTSSKVKAIKITNNGPTITSVSEPQTITLAVTDPPLQVGNPGTFKTATFEMTGIDQDGSFDTLNGVFAPRLLPLTSQQTISSGFVSSVNSVQKTNNTFSQTWKFFAEGQYEIECILSDSYLYTDTETTSLNILRSGAPVIGNISSNFTIFPDTTFTVTASNITDPDNDSLFYRWVLTKESNGVVQESIPASGYLPLSGNTISYTRTNGLAGGSSGVDNQPFTENFYVDLFVRDSLNNETTKRTIVTIDSQPPTLSVNYNPEISLPFYKFADSSGNLLNSPFQINCQITASDPDGGSIGTYTTRINSSLTNVTGASTTTPTLNFTKTGSYSISHLARDNEIQRGVVTNNIVVNRNLPPVVSMTNNPTSIIVPCNEFPKNITIETDVTDDVSLFENLTNPSISEISWPTNSRPTLVGSLIKIPDSIDNKKGKIRAIFQIPSIGTYNFNSSISELGLGESGSQVSNIANYTVNIQSSSFGFPSFTTPTIAQLSNPTTNDITINLSVLYPNGALSCLALRESTSSNILLHYDIVSENLNLINQNQGTYSIVLRPKQTLTPLGTYNLTVIAKDVCNNQIENQFNILQIVDSIPTVQITNPSQSSVSLDLPISLNLTAVGTDPDGGVLTYNWSLSGPSTTFNFSANNSASANQTILSNLNKEGTHTISVYVKDTNNVESSVATRTLIVGDPEPIANAGSDQSFTFALSTTFPKTFQLTGSGTDQTGGSISAYAWRIITNPGNAASLDSTTISDPVATISNFGRYTFGLIVTDNNGNTSAEDTVDIILNSDAPPTVTLNTSSANITLPTNSVTLTATTSSDVQTLTINETSGFGGLTITPIQNGPTTWTRTISGFKTNSDGTTRQYSFTATATDDFSQSITSDSVSVGVNNQVPTATVFIPNSINSILFNTNYSFGITGFASDPDGGSLSTPQFICTSVPASAAGIIPTFSAPTLRESTASGNTYDATCTIQNINSGDWVFKFSIKDDEGSTTESSTKTLSIVNNQPTLGIPTTKSLVIDFNDANAPLSFNTSLFGVTGTDVNTPNNLRFIWALSSRPTGAGVPTIGDSTSPNNGPTGATNIFFTAPHIGGTYQFSLRVSDANNLSSFPLDFYTIKRNSRPTVSITSPASDTSITLPINQISFATNATDSDGEISSYSWSSSPSANVSFSSTVVSNPTVTFAAAGTYTISVISTDNNGRQSQSASRTITVNANPAPVINSFTAITPVTISNGSASSTLTVNATDSQSLTYTFTQTSPASPLATITPGSGASSNQATVSNLTVPSSSSTTPSSRTYTFKVDVSDGTNTTSSTTDVVVNSSAPQIINLVNPAAATWTGTNQNIQIGNGASVSDPDGGTVTTSWTQVSGPSTPTILAPTSVQTNIRNFQSAGTYVFRLKATDNEGTFVEQDVTVTLNAALTPTFGTFPNNTVFNNNTSTNQSLSVSISNASSAANQTTVGPVTITTSVTPNGPTITPPTGQITNTTNNSITISNIPNMVAGTDYTVSVTATAVSTSATSNRTFTIRRNALPITPAITGSSTAQPGSRITFGINGGAATDPDGTISSYNWTVTPNTGVVLPTSTNSTSVGITFNTAGSYGINYSATDNNNETSTSGSFSVSITSPPADPCSLVNYYVNPTTFPNANNRFTYSLNIPNQKIPPTRSSASPIGCLNTGLAGIYQEDAAINAGANPAEYAPYDWLAGYAGSSPSVWAMRIPSVASNTNISGQYNALPFSNFPLRGMLINPGNPISTYYGNLSTNGTEFLRDSSTKRISRPYDLTFSFDSQNPNLSKVVDNYIIQLEKDLAGYDSNNPDHRDKFISFGELGYDATNFMRLDLGFPFIYRCSCWDANDNLVYTDWNSYTNHSTQSFNLQCPAGSTRKPRSLVIVRYRQEAIFTSSPGGVVNTACHAAIDGSFNASILTTDITAYYVSLNEATTASNQCKLGTGSYRLIKYNVNPTHNELDTTNIKARRTCRNNTNNAVCGTCEYASEFVSYKLIPHGSALPSDTSYYHFEQIPEGCPSNNTKCAPLNSNNSSWTTQRTYAEAKNPCNSDLPLVNYTSWKPPEYICLADCQNTSFQSGGVCVTNLTNGCAPPTCFAGGDAPPPLTDANGNENLIWIKIYNSEDSTQYECVPVLYDKTLLAQYELCEE